MRSSPPVVCGLQQTAVRKIPKIGVAAREAIEFYFAIPYGCKLTAQETWRRSMLGDRFEGIDNADARARLE